MIILLFGDDSFRSAQKLKELKNKFIKDIDPSKLNIEIFDNPKASLNEFSKAINAMPFLAKRRMIIFKNILQNSKNSELLKGINEIVKEHSKKINQEDTNVLVFYESSSSLGRFSLGKTLKKIDRCYEFEPLQGFALNKWIRNHVRDNGGRIDDDAEKELASLIGNDLWVMDSEIKKLISYSEDNKITKDIVISLVNGKFDDNIFELVDALGSKDKKKSLRLLNDHIASGAHEMYILSMLIRQFRIILGVKGMAAELKTKKEISLFLGVHPFVVQKAITQAHNYTFENLHAIYKYLLGIDAKFKRGVLKDRGSILFELLISKI